MNTHPVISINRTTAGRHVGRHVSVAWEEPDLNEVVGSLHGVPPPSDSVQTRTVAVCTGRLNTAPSVSVGVYITVEPRRSASLSSTGGHRAICTGMEGHRVWRLVVNTFDPREVLASKPLQYVYKNTYWSGQRFSKKVKLEIMSDTGT